MIPGPLATESRCPPSSTTPLCRPGRSAITLAARAVRVETESSMCTVLDGPRSAATADETIRTGILTVAKSVAMSGAVCPGVPSFAISAAAAPAASAFRAFWVKGQSPRFMRAIGAVRESAEVRGGAAARSRGAVNRNDPRREVPAARVPHDEEVRPLPVAPVHGLHTLEHGRLRLAEEVEGERLEPGPIADGAELPHDVGHRLRVPGSSDGAVSRVPPGDRLESSEVRPQPRRSDRTRERRGRSRRASRRFRLALVRRRSHSRNEQDSEPHRERENSHVSR